MDVKRISKLLIIVYFGSVCLFMISTLFEFKLIRDISFLSRMPIFFVLYFLNSKQKKNVYFLTLLLYQLSSVFYVQEGMQMFFYGSIMSLLFKTSLLFLLRSFFKKENIIAFVIASLPFFVVYLYIIQFVINALVETYFIWILNALITSLIGGIAIITYLNNSSQKTFWLLISAILLLIQVGGFFIHKFYIYNIAIYQIVILAYTFSQFTFYRFMIFKDNEGLNNSTL